METRSGLTLICVDPAQVGHFWPHVEPLLRPAIEDLGLDSFQDIEEAILIGCGLVWIVWSGEKIEGAASTCLQNIEGKKICVITAAGGTMRDCLPFMGQIEQYAKAEGCEAMRIFGRKGWLRALEDYREIAVVIEKDLS